MSDERDFKPTAIDGIIDKLLSIEGWTYRLRRFLIGKGSMIDPKAKEAVRQIEVSFRQFQDLIDKEK